ncbi:diguanylate cyclase [Crenobacter sp. SG2305]|uniref:diguanylate cyclase domain-containing protein n=1 Tax=Crenobacter oryzisoli TaxID=3056844 RepID=UPI0025AA39D2|nr:diguanylate cyclase [Crenobacter sp. SG2305]MDN0082965.1 diguanylate cyclase [Crenobacter sp. SG2305]
MQSLAERVIDRFTLPARQASGASSAWPMWLATLVLVVAYAGTGKLCLLLAISPGYASAIFPPAGVAVGAAFIIGWRAYPGVFLGSTLLNLWVSYAEGGHHDVTGLLAALLIALSSTVQAAAGGWALRKAITYPAAFDNIRDVARFQLLSPFICLISATLSVASLTALGIIAPPRFGMHWLIWWVGDTLGVLVILPLTLVVAGEPRALWRRRAITLAVPMALAFSLLVVLYVNISRWEHNDSLVEFRLQSQRLADNVQSRLDEQEALLEQIERLFANEDDVSPDTFYHFTRKALQRFPMVQAIEWAPRITAAERNAFETAQRRRIPGYQIRERDAQGGLQRAGERDYYYPVSYLEPLTGNRQAAGFDLASSLSRRTAIVETERKGSILASAPVRLVQGGAGEQSGFLLLQSVTTRSGQQGLVLSVIKVNSFMAKLLTANMDQLFVRMVDIGAGQAVYDSFPTAKLPVSLSQTLELGGRHYRLETAPSPAYLARHAGWQSWVVLAAGTLGTGLLGALLMLGTGHTARVELKVEQRTAELRESEARVREITAALGEGVYVIDRHGRIVFSNPEAHRLLGWSERELQNSDAHALFHHRRADSAQLSADACAMMSVLWTQQVYRGEEVFWRQDGRSLPVEVCASPIVRDGQSEGAVIVFRDISERKSLEDKLRRQAFYDALTELPNRRYFMDCLQQAILRAQRSQQSGAVLYMDMDGFKQINDAFGHEAGDQVLRQFALRLQESVRKIDSVARLGGDEFTIILEGLADPSTDAREVARKVIDNLSRPVLIAQQNVRMSTSIGIAVFGSSPDESPDSVLSRADMAMYRAKQSGKDGVAYS